MAPDNRQHRGAHPADGRLFDADHVPVLRRATSELSWLLSRGYSMTSSLKLVGDRHNLRERARLAISRAACPDPSRENRAAKRLPLGSVGDQHLIIDGFNLIITVEAALGGGVLFICRDGCIRDLSSVHGSYRSVLETERAICLIGEALAALRPRSVHWLLDKPVSNSGRLAQTIKDLAAQHDWPWSVEVSFSPDAAISSSDKIAVTTDSSILDKVAGWINFNDYLIRKHLPQSWIVDLTAESKQ